MPSTQSGAYAEGLHAGRAEMLDALLIARQYVYAMHKNIADAMGHERTVIRPDLERTDAAIAAAKKQPCS